MALLSVSDLQMYYGTLRGPVRAVDGVSFEVRKGQALGVAGESGCGKSSIAISLLRLLPFNGRVVAGAVALEGLDLLDMPEEEFRKSVRWKKISMVFQGAMNALNPVLRVGDQIAEAIRTHEDVSRQEALARARELLDLVGISPGRLRDYPHEFSGGMKQRSVIAMALACKPDLIIADEPTTALDVMVQAQVLSAVEGLRNKLGLSMMLITHDLSVIAQTCDQVAVMYAGKIVEYGSAEHVYGNPLHPYTKGLMRAYPDISAERSPVTSIPGSPPDLVNPPSGCRFHPRCSCAGQECRDAEPASRLVVVHAEADTRRVACHKV